jgi:mono/diheme cytochrome c family protein
MRRVLRLLSIVVILLIVAAAGFVLWSRRPEIAAIEPPSRQAFSREQIEKGAELAAVGDCNICHTASGGAAYAGGRPIPTPFGTIYSTNITPDPETGIGRWSQAAFRRAMREGIARDGRHLYPAFPYDHFARATDDDLNALYAFVMTRQPVASQAPANRLRFPFNQRWLLAFWDLLYLDTNRAEADPKHDAQWNRGAYLVEGLGHCGDCHTPRNRLGAEKSGLALAGGEAEGWLAPALNGASPAPSPWDKAQIAAYLRQGWANGHGAAAGPMKPVTSDLAKANESDVEAIAAYIADQMAAPSADGRTRSDALLADVTKATSPAKPSSGEELGATIFVGACAACHIGSTAIAPPRGIDLALSTVFSERDPRDAIFIVLDGIRPPDGQPGPWMPRFDGAFTDAQVAALLNYLRAHYGTGPAWPNLEQRVRDVRESKERS